MEERVARNRTVALPGETVLGAAEVVVEIPQSSVAIMALELAMLLTNASDVLTLRCSAGPSILLTVTANERTSRATGSRKNDGTLAFALGANQARFLYATLLRAYRDQMAEVNHVHIEAELAGQEFDLTIMFDVYRAPM